MPKYIDTHQMKPLTAQQLREAQNASQDEFGVTHHDILFSEKDDKVWCILNAPNKDAVEKHHAKVGIKCESIHEVMSTKE